MAKTKVSRRLATKAVAEEAFEASLTPLQVEQLEKSAQHPDHGCARRMGLAVLSRSKEQLCGKMRQEDFDVIDEIRASVSAYVVHLTGVLDAMKSAEARLICVMASIVEAEVKP